MTMTTSSRTIVLKSSDGETFEMKEAEAQQSALIKGLIEKHGVESALPIPKVTGNILSKVIEYCQKHVNMAGDSEALRRFDSELVDADEVTLVRIGRAARNLEIDSLFRLIHGVISDKIEGKSVDEICDLFMRVAS